METINEQYRDFYTRPDSPMQQLSEALPELMREVKDVRELAMRGSELPKEVAELVALGIAIASRCDTSIDFHVRDALDAGATPEQIVGAIGVALFMGGEPAAIHGWRALDVLRRRATPDFEGQQAPDYNKQSVSESPRTEVASGSPSS